jgi:acyl carrier protein
VAVEGASSADISAVCIRRVAKLLDMPESEISPDATFSRLGLDSAKSVSLLLDLEEQLGIEISEELIADFPCVSALSAELARLCAAQARGS